MSDTPLRDALDDIAKNQILIEGGASKGKGAELHGSLEREKGRLTVGVDAGISQKKSWSAAGFFKWVWGK